jgi:tetratricopeptide (TPR) repeat protein
METGRLARAETLDERMITDTASERAEADGLLRQARELPAAEAPTAFDEAVARFGGSPAAEVQERVAMALLEKGLALDKLERHEDEIHVYDELLERFAATEDPKTLEHVAWAAYDKALALRKLDREEEAAATYRGLIDRFRDTDAAEIRPRVSWSLWELYDLGKRGLEDTCRDLAERGDDEFDPSLREFVLFAYCTLGSLADQAGDAQSALRIFDELVARAGETTDPAERTQVNNGLIQKAYVLDRLGEYDNAIAVYDELIPRLDENEQTDQAIDSRRRRAIACDRAGRSHEAIAGYDDALALLVDASEPPLRQQAFRLLTSKALTLRTLKRREEALIVVGSALSAYRALDPDAAAPMRETAVRALMERLQLLCELERSGEAADVERELVLLLGDVTALAAVEPAAKPPEDEIAALLADVHASDCWTLFESPPAAGAPQLEAMALELYRRTDALLQPPIDDWDAPEVAAGTIIRQVADGFALLSESFRSTTLALPQRRLLEWAIRLAGIDEWAAELGHPLKLEQDSEDIRKLLDGQPEPEDDFADDCAAACVAALYQRDLLAALCDSEAGQQTLRGSTHRWLAARQLNSARSWGGWAFTHGDDAQPATAAAILVAQAYYRATHGIVSSAELTPTRDTLRELLRHADGLGWLESRGFVLPEWLDVGAQ